MKFLIRLSIINFLFFLLLVLFNLSNNTSPTVSVTPTNPPQNSTPVPTTGIPQNQLASHNTINDCWVSYNNHTYNVTSFINLHPGGPEAIIKYCGSDITNAFNTKDRFPPQSHSSNALNILMSLLIK